MIYVNQPISYTMLGVQLHDDDWFEFEWVTRGPNFKPDDSNLVHTRKSNWPTGVIPVAVRASTIIQRKGGQQLSVSAVGLGLTKTKAHCDAQQRLRHKLTKLAKMNKAIVSYGPTEVIICRKDNSTNVFGRGKTFALAVHNLQWNLAELERLSNALPPPTNQEHVLVMEPTEKTSWLKKLISIFR
ncbi:hypothetical protein HYP85_gp024 [Pseudomonas phage Zuri]|uniref:RNA polymerase n=1 Tax=Pseudomonas phage Zuri TaxID=2604899 RepID=A0A5C1K4Z2_9CAUD|nr:hypothetical protein HYP85_gp024 [Pseudomonas phage Zuri]QEM41121.1 RNA polymerase [Pseudomonas phage Zuri]